MDKIFVSKSSGTAYPVKENGQIDLQHPLPNADLSIYKKLGENNVFIIYEPKKTGKNGKPTDKTRI